MNDTIFFPVKMGQVNKLFRENFIIHESFHFKKENCKLLSKLFFDGKLKFGRNEVESIRKF